MILESLGSQQRANADRKLSKILLAGLCGSAMFHTFALAGVSYLSQNSIDDLEITPIERVELDPDPVPTPSAPTPAPKIVKPIIAAVPIPVPVKIPTPTAILTPPPVVKIVKSKVVIQPPTSPVAKVVAPVPNRVSKPATPVKVASKSNSLPVFADRLFTDPIPRIERPQPQLAAPQQKRKVDRDPTPQPIAKAAPGRTLPPGGSTPAPTPSKLSKLAPDTDTENNSSNDELTPIQPDSTSKLARLPDRSPAGNNQTNLPPEAKSLPGLANDSNPKDSNPVPSNDDFGSGKPGNNTQIDSNNKATNPDPNINQTGLGGGNRRNPSIGGNLEAKGSGNSPSGGSGELRSGIPGNIATGTKSQVSIQCLRNCEIRYPDSLETLDTGKDKILVRVSIDRNGSVTSAEIIRSSGNPKLDQATLAGVKQMQLTAMGKPLTFRIKVSTLSR